MPDYDGYTPREIANEVGVLARVQKALDAFERVATEAQADMHNPAPLGEVFNHIADMRSNLRGCVGQAEHALGSLPDPEAKGAAARSHATLGLGGGA